ncbi:MAG: DUF2157 domain-containing protein [Acidimicrobiia bacterium]
MAVDESHVAEWVDKGLISQDEADAIHAYEAARAPSGGGIREVLGYLGGLLVLIAVFILVAELWAEMKRGGRIAIAGSAAVALIVAGIYLVGGASRSMRRVGEVTLMLAAAPLGLAVGLTFGDQANEEPLATMAFAGALIYSVIVYRWHSSWAQHVALVGSAIGGAISLGVTVTDESMHVAAALLVVLGVALLAASWRGWLPPRVLSEVGGLIALGLASIFVVGDLATGTSAGRVAMAVCIVVATGLIVAGVYLDRIALIAGGALGLLGYLPVLIDDVVPGEAGGPISLLAAGLILIGSAVLLTRRQQGR